jgi:low affinity Fe/Cu permease
MMDPVTPSSRKLPSGKQTSWFDHFSKLSARAAGRSVTFTLACTSVLTWIATGPLFHYSDTWQLAINTATTIITFLMVFLIQHTQNIESQAVQIKLDELIRATKGAHNALLDLEQMTEKQLDEIRVKYETLAKIAKLKQRSEEDDLGSPDVGLQADD